MSIKASLSSDGLEEVYTAPSLKEMCLYKCLTNKDILTKEVDVVDQATNGSEELDWEKFRLKEPIQRELVEALLDAGDELLFRLTPTYRVVLAAIRMSQPEHLVKVHVTNSLTLQDCQLELLLSGDNVKSLDIHGCKSLRKGSLDAINKFGNKLEYLRIGDSVATLPEIEDVYKSSAILTTPNLKTFIVSGICHDEPTSYNLYWRLLLQAFISNLEDLQIIRSGSFETLEFLEPAKTKLKSLTLRTCVVTGAKALASLFKLDKLRSLELVNLVGTSIREALADENLVQHLLTAMPNLTRLVVDPGLIKNVDVDTCNRGIGSVAKRLEFLGLIGKDEAELRKANLLANDVAHFGTVDGELRILEYFSNRRLNPGDADEDAMKRLLRSLFKGSRAPRFKSVGVINLILKYIKFNHIRSSESGFLSRISEMLTPDVVPKLGDVLINQYIGAIFFIMTKTYWGHSYEERNLISGAIDIMTNLDANGKLSFDHFATIVPTVMLKAEAAMRSSGSNLLDIDFKGLLKKMAQLLEKAVNRFPEETDELWGISSVLVVIRQLKEVLVFRKRKMFDSKIGLVEIFSSMIASVSKLCVNSSPRRAAFHSAKGVGIVMELLSDINNGRVAGLSDRVSFDLLEILKSVVEDTKLDLSESGKIARGLEKLLLSIHSRLKGLEGHSNMKTILWFQQEIIVSMLSYLESNPRFHYKTSGAVNKLMMKLKYSCNHFRFSLMN